jgi:hypothetical protein
MSVNVTTFVATSRRAISPSECQVSRVLGSCVLAVATFSLVFNMRFLHWSTSHGAPQSRHNMFIVSMILSSTMVTLIMLPSVSLQCWSCDRLQSIVYCQLEGFVSYLNGCVHMFLLMMVSIYRYITVLYGGTTRRYFLRQSNVAVLISWLLGCVFAVPPLFDFNRYIPEGLGFHCGLNWFDRSRASRAYLLASMLFVYVIPLLVLCVVNTYAYWVIRRLLNRAVTNDALTPIYLPLIHLSSSKHLSQAFASSSSTATRSVRLSLSRHEPMRIVARSTTDPSRLRHALRMNRLKADRHFAVATIFLVGEYLLSWTPYACVALLYLFDVKFIDERPLLVSMCASIAKMSMIINPFVYIAAIKRKQVNVILFGGQCSCARCRTTFTIR